MKKFKNNEKKKRALRLRKFFFNNHVHFITCSVEEGIMLPANPLSKFLIKAAIVRAQMHHPVKISHFIVNGTHMHMIVRVENPEDVPGFMERFKTESSHYINRLLNRKKRTIWCKSYDSPRCYNVDDVIDRIVYTYMNPVKDGLIESVDNYPGLSSWHLFNGNQKRLFGRLMSRDEFYPIDQNQDYVGFKKFSKRLAKAGKLTELEIDTNDWLKAFGISDSEEVLEINKLMKTRIQEETLKKQAEYEKKKKTFMGRAKLENQGIDKYYQRKPQSGRKFWVFCKNKKQRASYILFLKELAKKAIEVYEDWCRGNTSLRMPIGVFAPRMPVVANLIGA